MHPLRHSLLAALGLVACGPIDKGTGGDDSSSSGTSASSDTTGPTTGGPTTENPTTVNVTTDNPTSGSESATATATGTSGEVTTVDPDTGSEGTSGTDDTGAPACDTVADPAEQAFTDPPVPSGFERCNDGILHRLEKVACESPTTPDSCMDNMLGGCSTAADCTEKPNGSCQQDMIFGGFTEGTCSCVYGCATDEDCGQGQICRCAGDGLGLYTQCIEAGCTQDNDCPDGELCGLSPDLCAPGGFLTACTTPEDLCDGDGACANPPCSFQKDHWECANAACGRPFVVDCEAVVAPVAERDDWRALLLAPSPASPELAPELAAYWTRIGQLEHASVAAFAQFVLQLLAVAAPPSLVLAAQSALADEVEHARLAFALASLHAGVGVGPGPLAITRTDISTDLPALVDAVIREACVGETLAAFEAREAAAHSEVPAVRAALTKISGDELRHAELGWRFVQWALSDADEHAHARAQATFAAAVAEAHSGVARDQLADATPHLRAHGVVDAPLRAQIWAQGLREVIEPCAAALLKRSLAA
jgi:hypothetical protein